MKDFLINLIVADYAIGIVIFLIVLLVMLGAWFRDGISDYLTAQRIGRGESNATARCRYCEDQPGGCPVCMPRRRGR